MNIIYSDFPENIQIKFDSFLLKYTKNHASRKKELEKIVKLHDCGLDNYLKYRILLKLLTEKGLHTSDIKIIIDAHDLGLTSEVSFNTTDREFYNLIKSSNCLKIKEYNLVN